ncbi:hypothetical protein LLB_1926 [Legionella longbeachae D-4968]|nr:hypothetical protein LLB_1926 [Legionella longbeachae D-4968]
MLILEIKKLHCSKKICFVAGYLDPLLWRVPCINYRGKTTVHRRFPNQFLTLGDDLS